jgi:hypothetical protein
VATLAAATGVFFASSIGMPMPAGIDALGRSGDWMLKHGLPRRRRLLPGAK